MSNGGGIDLEALEEKLKERPSYDRVSQDFYGMIPPSSKYKNNSTNNNNNNSYMSSNDNNNMSQFDGKYLPTNHYIRDNRTPIPSNKANEARIPYRNKKMAGMSNNTNRLNNTNLERSFENSFNITSGAGDRSLHMPSNPLYSQNN